ncbi:hypothetical protein JV173_01895 [Acholeplasma equirhinis]|uniref:hypothetical protein n=1 Tax=Acholeplasma equirhinis TaxID=555393 RepID=UPI00197A7198|nr:hypothetical protein [Acholeplasma equirhinis]MBN3490257.1 hypothetical protein [Acholeplasma equirhinis]
MINTILFNANEFFEAARRCDFPKGEVTKDNFPLMIPEFVNRAFACELYIKAIAEFTKVNIKKNHKLDELFKEISDSDQEAIYSLWRTTNGNNMIDSDYVRKQFWDNLEAITNVFVRFRYAHEWITTTISLEHSFTAEQFTKFSPMSASKPFGSPRVYSGFLKQFAISLKVYAEKLILFK